jgi:hypothetical protein
MFTLRQMTDSTEAFQFEIIYTAEGLGGEDGGDWLGGTAFVRRSLERGLGTDTAALTSDDDIALSVPA